MSLVRVGMSENKGYAEGYEAIFGKRDRFKPADPKPADEPKPDVKAEQESPPEAPVPSPS